jgi:hypothetical protein
MAPFDLRRAVAEAAPGTTVAVPAGNYLVNLLIERPVSLIAIGQVVLDAGGSGSVVRIDTPGKVRLAGFTLVGGQSPEGGGGVCVAQGEVELLQCTLRHNRSPSFGGGALLVKGSARVRTQQCRFEANSGRQGGACLAQNAAVLGGALRVREQGRAVVRGCTFADNKVVGDGAAGGAVHLGGSSTQTPSVTLSHCVLGERAPAQPLVFNGPSFPGTLTVEHSLLPEWCRLPGVGNRFGQAGFQRTGSEPYQLTPGSLAVGAASDGGYAAGAKDLSGRPRAPRQGSADLGAFALVR